MDGDVDTVAARKHQLAVDVAVDDVVAEGYEPHQYSTFHM
jgi:hypothetical protein